MDNGSSTSATDSSGPSASPRLDLTCVIPKDSGELEGTPLLGRRVLLDGASCVSTRSCSPDTANLTNRRDPRFMAILRDYSLSDAVAGPFPSARMGCALSYDVDFSRFRSGIAPSDMPAGQNGAATMLGGRQIPFRVDPLPNGIALATAGRYIPKQQHGAQGTKHASRGLQEHIRSTPTEFPPLNGGRPSIAGEMAAAADLGVAIGPYAVYRGAVPARAYPPYPNATLPIISGGSW